MFFRKTGVVLLSTLLPFFSFAEESEEGYRKRIHAHLLLSDLKGAMGEGEKALEQFPGSKKLLSSYLLALAERGEELRALEVWSQRGVFSLQDPVDRKMLEMLAWGVLKKAEASSQLLVRLNGLVGAAMTHDAKAVPLILTQLRSSNATMRLVAIRLSAFFGDDPLKREMVRLLKEEKVWFVRLEVIAAAGQLRLYEAKELLKEIASASSSLAEEKAAAISALAGMYDSVEEEELFSLLNSDRAGLRRLALELIFRLELRDKTTLLARFLHDTSSEVKVAALNVISFLNLSEVGTKAVKNLVRPLLDDPSFEVAITAAFILLLQGDAQGVEQLAFWLQSEIPECRRLASAALAVSGKSGLPLTIKTFAETQDPYVKINLARALIGQREQVDLAAEAIDKILTQEKRTLWMWEGEGCTRFQSLAPSQVRHQEGVANYPAVVDQLVRLELLSTLSRVGYERSQEAVKEFLKTKSWTVSGMAAALILQEGNEEDLEVVRNLLQDSDEKIRCLAALILGAVGKDSSAVAVLQEVYPKLDRELKVHVLQALGYVGDCSSIPFLLEVLQEPFQILRVVAASALIQCLYH